MAQRDKVGRPNRRLVRTASELIVQVGVRLGVSIGAALVQKVVSARGGGGGGSDVFPETIRPDCCVEVVVLENISHHVSVFLNG